MSASADLRYQRAFPSLERAHPGAETGSQKIKWAKNDLFSFLRGSPPNQGSFDGSFHSVVRAPAAVLYLKPLPHPGKQIEASSRSSSSASIPTSPQQHQRDDMLVSRQEIRMCFVYHRFI